MFFVRGSPRNIPGVASKPFLRQQWRRNRSQISKDALRPTNPLAEQLSNTGLWNYGRWAKKGVKRPKGDKYRVNIVSEKLCDDTLAYIKPSLQRHLGCDIIDLYPGAGLWSSKLHEALQPRSHILLEPDEAVYRPFLEPLLAKPNTTLIPKSGIIWRELNSVLDHTHLPHQLERPAGASEPPQRNDTLLVTANLAFHPKRRFAMFESLTQLVLYQFISSIRAASLFGKYGLVRMFVWVEGSDRHALLARSCQRRRRLAIDAELATDSVTEVAGPDDFSQWFVRDQGLDMASCRRVAARMASANVHVPPGRESKALRAVQAAGEDDGSTPDAQPAVFARPWKEEYRSMAAQFQAGKFTTKSPEHRRLLQLQYRGNREAKVADAVHTLLQKRDELAAAYESSDSPTKVAALKRREAKWNAEVDALPASSRKEFILHRDNLHLFQQDPPVLAWDRREIEPLLVQDTEFFPNAPCALLDIQPKAMHPLLRAMGPASSRSGDMFEMILRGMMAMGADPVSKSIETIWPGAAEGVLPHCPSLRNRSDGGMPVGGYAELSARSLNEKQWTELLDAWMRWPFRPSLSELVARSAEEGDMETEDELGDTD
ncbi:rRNA adenine dimethylase-like protein [Niveomyces insectorum RCEF 264]|uniref:rRNA adenine N(6)-methyltransferase n=1 Tax=Niveomyces insectorum RCEF 264 TaxID=1081102 RepID=A0A162MQQ9_9HYPO|nr:rRNA adenine dimethylase-like protein [Niveomyces insectorum RCEF 264]